MKRKLFRIAAAVSAFTLVFSVTGCGSENSGSASANTVQPSAGPASAAEPEPVKIVTTTSAVKGSPAQVMQECIDEVFDEKGQGWFEFEHFDSSTLYKQDAEYGAIYSGNVDMVFASPSIYADNGLGWFGMFDAPYVFDSVEHQQKIFDPYGEIGQEISDRIYKDTDENIKVLGVCTLGTRTLWLRDKDRIVRTPEDLASVKLRVPNSNAYLTMGRALGAQPTPLDGNETYLALQTGAIDAQENVILSSYNAKFQEVCGSICRTDHTLGCQVVAINGGTWRKMTEEQQTLFVELMQEAIRLQSDRVLSEEARILDELEAGGMVMQTPDREAFRSHVLEYYTNDSISDSWDMDLLDRVNALR